MIRLSKQFLKLFIVFSFIFLTSTAVMAEEEKDEKSKPLFNKTKKNDGSDGKVMKSLSWNPPKKEEEESTENEEGADEEEIEETSNEELTPEQKLWEKYKELAEGKNNNKNEDVEEEDETSEEETEEASAEDDSNEEEIMGLKGILESYKKAQDGKGKMNSRSFGKLD